MQTPPEDSSPFDTLISRRHSASLKWDSLSRSDLLPLWVADMDFRTSPAIIEALSRRVQHGIFGYTRIPPSYYDAVRHWYRSRHGWSPEQEWMLVTTGVVPAISAILRALTRPGDGVLIQPPVYNCFYSSIRNLGCQPIPAPLEELDGTYSIDFERLESRAADPRTTVMLLCNPHNPVGRVWREDELKLISDICQRHGLIVIADEIHGDLTMPGYRYIPYASVCDDPARCITCVSASKTFNLAGLQNATIITPDPGVKQSIDRALNIHEVCDLNPFGITATIAAYTQGEAWLEQLLTYLHANAACLQHFLAEHLPQCPMTPLEGTYLAWVDTRRLPASTGSSHAHDLLEQTGLWLSDGSLYGDAGRGFLRWNLACPRRILSDAMERFLRYVHNLPVSEP